MFSGMNEENINIFHASSESRSSETLVTSCKPKSADTCSVFGDSNCGEPLYAQHLVIDFTPNDEDNDYVQKKCCAFWDFINTLPQIQHLMVLPESHRFVQPSTTTSFMLESSEDEQKPVAVDRTALSMLEISENRGLIDRIFEAKLPYKTCSIGSREYMEQEEITQHIVKKKHGCQWPCPCRLEHCVKPMIEKKSPLKAMVTNMQNWDKEHPKSMQPPGHPPSLQHCTFHREVYPANKLD